MIKITKTGTIQRYITPGKQILLFILSIALFANFAHAETTIPSDVSPECTVSASDFHTWFKSGTVTANGAVNPADSLHFDALDAVGSTDCPFFEWAERMFLWVTSPSPVGYGGGGGRVFNSPVFFGVTPQNTSGHRTFIKNTPGKILRLKIRGPQTISKFTPPPIIGRNMLLRDKRGRMFRIEKAQITSSGMQLIRNKAGKVIEVKSVRIRKHRAIFLDKRGRAIRFDLKHRVGGNVNIIRHHERHRITPSEKMHRIDRDDDDIKANRHPRDLPKIQRPVRLPIAHEFIGAHKIPIFVDDAGNVLSAEAFQATQDVLMAQNHSLVYYEIEVNDVFTYFATGNKDGGILPPLDHFPTSTDGLTKITNFASAHGKTFSDANALAVTLKTSWVEAKGLDTSKYITMKATIPKYDTSNSTHWVLKGQRQAVLALVGMHVVGSTGGGTSANGHPEMIWATFEHVDNTPNANYMYTKCQDTACDQNSVTTVHQNTAGHWLFCASNSTGPFNSSNMTFDSSDIIAKPGRTISPSDTLRTKPWGKLGSESGFNDEVLSMNQSILTQLASGDIRKNYVLIGATWTHGGGDSLVVGTNLLSNTTLETYTQGDANVDDSPSHNCFSCHMKSDTNALATPSGGFLSHIFGDLQPLF